MVMFNKLKKLLFPHPSSGRHPAQFGHNAVYSQSHGATSGRRNDRHSAAGIASISAVVGDPGDAPPGRAGEVHVPGDGLQSQAGRALHC